MEKLQVDVVLPYYEGQQWVEEAIDSVLAQTYPHWHLTIVDDASPDEALSDIKVSYEARTDRISFIRLQQRETAVGARMEAIWRTCGQAIAFIDQDDRWHPQKLERQIARLEREPTVQAVHTDVQHIDSQGNILPGSADRENAYRANIRYDTLESSVLARHLFYMDSIRLVSAVISRVAFEEVGGFDESLCGSEDWEFWVRFAATGHRIAHLASPLVQRRLHRRNVSRSCSQERLLELLHTTETVAAAYPNLSDLIPDRKSLLLRQIITDQLLQNQGGQVRSRIKQLVNLDHGNSKIIGYVFWALSYLGPLQSLLTGTALRLGRRLSPQGGLTPSELL